MIQKEIQPHDMLITPQLMKSVSTARYRYCLHIEEQKKDKVQKEIDSKKQGIINELQSVKGNCQGIQDLIREFDITFVNLSKKTKNKENNDIKFLIEGNALNKKAEEKGTYLEILKKRKEELISEIKKVSLNKTDQ